MKIQIRIINSNAALTRFQVIIDDRTCGTLEATDPEFTALEESLIENANTQYLRTGKTWRERKIAHDKEKRESEKCKALARFDRAGIQFPDNPDVPF